MAEGNSFKELGHAEVDWLSRLQSRSPALSAIKWIWPVSRKPFQGTDVCGRNKYCEVLCIYRLPLLVISGICMLERNTAFLMVHWRAPYFWRQTTPL